MQARADQQTVRRHNLTLVLDAVHRHGRTSRAQIAVATGLTKATVSAQVQTLLAAGILHEVGAPTVASGPGRPGRLLEFGPRCPVGIGVEINVDTISTCLVDLSGRIRHEHRKARDNRDEPPRRVVDRAATSVRTAIRHAARLGVPIAGIGVAVPGLVAAGEGVVKLAPNLGWRDVPVLDLLLRAAGLDRCPAWLGNEASHAALGELWFGGHPDLTDFVLVSADVGVGAGVVRAGRLLSGVHGFAGEIGHQTVDPKGPPCPCGSRGCLERMAGREAILAAAGIAPTEPLDTLLGRLAAGDRRALTAVRNASRALALGLGNVLNLLDLTTVVLSGAYARLAPWMTDELEAEVARRVVWTQWTPIRILRSELGTSAVVRGSAGVAARAVLADPATWLERLA